MFFRFESALNKAEIDFGHSHWSAITDVYRVFFRDYSDLSPLSVTISFLIWKRLRYIGGSNINVLIYFTLRPESSVRTIFYFISYFHQWSVRFFMLFNLLVFAKKQKICEFSIADQQEMDNEPPRSMRKTGHFPKLNHPEKGMKSSNNTNAIPCKLSAI